MLDVNDSGYPEEATIGDQSLRAVTHPAPSLLSTAPLRLKELIAKKAYELYLRRGKIHGHDLDDWLEAERIVLSGLAVSQKRTGH